MEDKVKTIKKTFLLCIMIVFTLSFVGCGKNTSKGPAPDDLLLSFLPSLNESYSGDSGYFHVIKSIEKETTESEVVSLIKGEVRDNTLEATNKNFDFEIRWVVNSESILQTTQGTELNETVFSEIVVLKRPIEVGNSWVFTTTNQMDKKVKVTGKIISIDSDGEVVVVKYSTKDGYSEERTLRKGRGTTDFTRLVVYKNESSITGYHSENGSALSTDSTIPEHTTEDAFQEEFPVTEVKIPVAAFNLILGFDQSWADYVKQENDDLLKFILEDSPAMEKINAVTRDAATAIEFVKYYPYELKIEAPYTIVKVVETFVTLENEEIKNKVQYTMIADDNVFKLYDFERIE